MCAPSADELWDQIDRKTLTRRPHTPRCVRLGRSITAESEHGGALPND
jgi:hypothetical protein